MNHPVQTQVDNALAWVAQQPDFANAVATAIQNPSFGTDVAIVLVPALLAELDRRGINIVSRPLRWWLAIAHTQTQQDVLRLLLQHPRVGREGVTIADIPIVIPDTGYTQTKLMLLDDPRYLPEHDPNLNKELDRILNEFYEVFALDDDAEIESLVLPFIQHHRVLPHVTLTRLLAHAIDWALVDVVEFLLNLQNVPPERLDTSIMDLSFPPHIGGTQGHAAARVLDMLRQDARFDMTQLRRTVYAPVRQMIERNFLFAYPELAQLLIGMLDFSSPHADIIRELTNLNGWTVQAFEHVAGLHTGFQSERFLYALLFQEVKCRRSVAVVAHILDRYNDIIRPELAELAEAFKDYPAHPDEATPRGQRMALMLEAFEVRGINPRAGEPWSDNDNPLVFLQTLVATKDLARARRILDLVGPLDTFNHHWSNVFRHETVANGVPIDHAVDLIALFMRHEQSFEYTFFAHSIDSATRVSLFKKLVATHFKVAKTYFRKRLRFTSLLRKEQQVLLDHQFEWMMLRRRHIMLKSTALNDKYQPKVAAEVGMVQPELWDQVFEYASYHPRAGRPDAPNPKPQPACSVS
jgi:hypothetical protein